MIECPRCGSAPTLLAGELHAVQHLDDRHTLHLPVWVQCQCGTRCHVYDVGQGSHEDVARALDAARDDWRDYQQARGTIL